MSKWHHAYDALMVERNALVRKILETEKSVSVKDHANGYECVMILRDAYNDLSDELSKLRKHEVAWDLDKAQIKVYEQRLAEAEEIRQLKASLEKSMEHEKEWREKYNSKCIECDEWMKLHHHITEIYIKTKAELEIAKLPF